MFNEKIDNRLEVFIKFEYKCTMILVSGEESRFYAYNHIKRRLNIIIIDIITIDCKIELLFSLIIH